MIVYDENLNKCYVRVMFAYIGFKQCCIKYFTIYVFNCVLKIFYERTIFYKCSNWTELNIENSYILKGLQQRTN